MEKLDQNIINLYDEYTHKPLDRRVFLDKLITLVGSSAAALALLPILQNNYAFGAIVPEDDYALEADTMELIIAGNRKIKCYHAKLKGLKHAPAVVIVHENRGLNPHIKDITRRFAKEGFFAFAPDGLSLVGGTPSDEDKAREMINSLNPAETLGLYMGAIESIATIDGVQKIGAVGFCWGGGLVNRLGANCGRLSGIVSYYGMTLDESETTKINTPLMLHYAGLDERINKGIVPFVQNLTQRQKEFTLHFYKDVNHAFNNDTNQARYDAKAANLSWQRTNAFLKTKLQN